MKQIETNKLLLEEKNMNTKRKVLLVSSTKYLLFLYVEQEIIESKRKADVNIYVVHQDEFRMKERIWLHLLYFCIFTPASFSFNHRPCQSFSFNLKRF